MTIEQLPEDFDCAAYTPDVAAVVNLLWADVDCAIVLVDADRRLLACNAAALPSLSDENVRIGEKLSASLRHIWLDDDVEECEPARQPMARAFAGETVRHQLIRFGTASYQELGRMHVSTMPINLHDGSRGVLLAYREVVDFERRDRREIRRLEQLLEGASDYAIVVLDLLGRVQTWSRSAQRLHGYSATEGPGLEFSRLFPEPDRLAGVPQRIFRQAVELGTARTEGLRVRQDGSTFWAEGAVSVLRNDVGEVCGYVEVAHDVSEKRDAAQEILSLNTRLKLLNHDLEDRIADRTEQLVRQTADLKAANAELESFSYSVSHNLRAPLRAIGGYARLFEEQYGGGLPPAAIGYLHKLTNSAVMMGQLIDGLLELSRAQRVSLVIEELDMLALVEQCWEALAPQRTDREIRLTVGDLPPTAGDRRLIYQVWLNLLENAIKYTSTRLQAEIGVTAAVHDDVVSYRVEDNGVGFDMTYADKIGQVFQRLHDGSEFPGTGIGMANVQRIVVRHGGKLTVHGEPNVGAAMEFSLWRAQ